MEALYILKIPDELDNRIYQLLLSNVSKLKREQINRFHRIEDGYRTLFAELLIRSIILKSFNIKNTDIKIQKNMYGKPFLDGFPDFSFNVSHSGEWVACIVDRCPVGVDVEIVKPLEYGNVKSVFSKSEREDLLKKDSSNWLDAFYDLWTLKESYVKALGKGLNVPLNTITVKKYSDDDIELFENGKSQPYFFKQYNIDEGYKLSVCSLNDKFPIKPKVVNYGLLIYDILHYVAD